MAKSRSRHALCFCVVAIRLNSQWRVKEVDLSMFTLIRKERYFPIFRRPSRPLRRYHCKQTTVEVLNKYLIENNRCVATDSQGCAPIQWPLLLFSLSQQTPRTLSARILETTSKPTQTPGRNSVCKTISEAKLSYPTVAKSIDTTIVMPSRNLPEQRHPIHHFLPIPTTQIPPPQVP
jgi:hypothetical protein